MQIDYEDFCNNYRTIFIAFYKIYPSYTGASEVSNNFFKYWPTQKKIFYFPYNVKNKKNYFLINFLNFFLKFLFTFLIFLVIKFKEIKNKKKNLIIIEGASWIFFSYIFYLLCQIFLKNTKILYHAHNIEYEVRNYKNNLFISFVTKIMEKKILHNTISTVVSSDDQKKVYKYYKIKPYILMNGINHDIIIKKKKRKDLQVIFPGNNEYYFNYISINKLLKIIPRLINKFPKIKFIFTGSNRINYNKKNKNIISSGILNKKKYQETLQKSNLLIYPATKAPGTKFKIIESLCYGIIVITTKEGLKGIKIIKNFKSIFIYRNYKQLEQLVVKCFDNFKEINKNAYKNANFYKKIYSFKNINNKFINNYLLNKL